MVEVKTTFVIPCCPQACSPNLLTGLCCNGLPFCSTSYLPCCSTICQPERNQPSLPPAIDPVSLAIALQAQKEQIREGKLHFGPNRLPLDLKMTCCPVNILEDGLHTLSRDIVELKPCCPTKTIAEEAAESYLGDDCCDIDCSTKALLSYADLGYAREIPTCAEFIPGAPTTSCQQGQVIYSGPAVPPSTCCCQQIPSCLPQPISQECASNGYQPGGLYVTQIGCRNGACPSELPCGCNSPPCNCVQQYCCC